MAKEEKSKISRRDFIKGTGYVVGGAAISSTVLAAACGKSPEQATTVDPVAPATGTTKYVCPYDNQQFASADLLKAHLNTVHGGASVSVAGDHLTRFKVNGIQYALKVDDNWSLAKVLREKLGLTGTRVSCDEGICGYCTVLIDGRGVQACMILACELEGANVLTVESMDDIKLYNVQMGFLEEMGFQCGMCTDGQVMGARALLETNTNPTREQVKEAMSGNLCLCSGYELIANSVLNAAGKIRAGNKRPVPPPSKYVTAAGGGA